MSVASATSYDRGTRGIIIGLIPLGGLILLSAIVAIAVLGTMLATGTLHQTDQGWVFRASAGSVTSAELKTGRFDVGARPNH